MSALIAIGLLGRQQVDRLADTVIEWTLPLDWIRAHWGVAHPGVKVSLMLLVPIGLLLWRAYSYRRDLDKADAQPQPKLVACNPHTFPTAMPSGDPPGTARTHFVACISFRNRPERREERAIAKDVNAELSVYRPDGEVVVEQTYGYWGDPLKCHEGGPYPFAKAHGSHDVTLAINGHPECLQVVHRQSDSGDCFVWKAHAPNDRVGLPDRTYVIHVVLDGQHVPPDSGAWLQLRNDGAGAKPPALEVIDPPSWVRATSRDLSRP